MYMVKIPYMEAGIVIMTDFSIVEKQKSANLGFCPNDRGRGITSKQLKGKLVAVGAENFWS